MNPPRLLHGCAVPISTLIRSLVFVVAMAGVGVAKVGWAQTTTPPSSTTPLNSKESTSARVEYITVPLPITATIDLDTRRSIDSIISGHKPAGPGQGRPIIVLEFRPPATAAEAPTDVVQAFSLARFLVSDRLTSFRTVAFLPRGVRGHSVLPVLACEEIIMGPDAELGEAGLDESSVDHTIRRIYVDMCEKRRTIPVSVVLAMLDRNVAVFRVTTSEGIRYVNSDELEKLKKLGDVTSVDSIVKPGELAKFTGRELRLTYGFVSHLAIDRTQLAIALRVPVQDLEEDPSQGKGWNAIRIDVSGPVHAKAISWIQRSLADRLADARVNLVCVVIDSSGGSLTQSLRFADYLAALPSSNVRTVAYVTGNARADAALIALACDQLVVSEQAILGGPGDAVFDERELPSLRESVRTLAQTKQRNWSVPVALLDSNVRLRRYSKPGSNQAYLFCDEELASLEDSQTYVQGSEIQTENGLSGSSALEFSVARFRADSFDEFRQLYHLDESLETLRPNWAHVFVEHLADPRISGFLLFVAWFALMVEFMTPGLSIAGFVSGVCFLLFFWANYLHGTAAMLEILLFIAGVGCVAAEIFVAPGVLVLGIGGGLLMAASIILASQTFTIPRNTYQLSQLPNSLFMVAAAGAGAIASIALMRRMLPETPLLKRLMLAPPVDDQREELEKREAIVNYDHLLGLNGVAMTRLIPGGKALIAGNYVDVISTGAMAEPDTPIRVVDVRGNHILVEIDT